MRAPCAHVTEQASQCSGRICRNVFAFEDWPAPPEDAGQNVRDAAPELRPGSAIWCVAKVVPVSSTHAAELQVPHRIERYVAPDSPIPAP